jgi:Ca2+-binding RTX toxin-like protein
VTNVENGFLTGSAGADDLTISGAQLDALIFGSGTIDFSANTDTLNLTSTSADLNSLGATDGSVVGVEIIDASNAATNVTIDLNGQSEDLIVSGSSSGDVLTTGAGDDTISGGAGADNISGGAGDDTLHGHGLTDTQIQSILTANPGIVYDAQTNSFYEAVLSFVNRTDAENDAATSLISGTSGHIMNITSAYESALYASLITGTDGWGGASDAAQEGRWIWTDGAEAGMNFWNGDFTGSAVAGAFTNWDVGVPDEVNGGEDYLQVQQYNNSWNDNGGPGASAGIGQYYIIEWDAGLISDDNAVDTINGGNGNDMIYGYGGADILSGNADSDILFGGQGNDTLNGGTGSDSTYGQEGNDIINLANGDFGGGEIIDGGSGTDELILTNATTVDFTTGTLINLETLTGSTGADDVTYSIDQALDFTTIDLGGGTDNSRVQVNGTVDVTALGTPTVSNAENGFLTGSAGVDIVTMTGAQLDALVYGSGTIDFGGNTDTLNLTSNSSILTTLGDSTDAGIINLENIDGSASTEDIILGFIAQTDSFNITGSGFDDILLMGDGDDVINGGGGADFIAGRDGVDTINGGSGDDEIELFGNGEFAIGESIDGGIGTDTIDLFDGAGFSPTIDFTRGTIASIENLEATAFDDDITMSISQFFAFDSIDYFGGTDAQTIDVSGTNDVTALTSPTVSNLESSSLLFSTGADDLAITGTQFDTLTDGATVIDTLGGADVLNITSTSTNLNTLGTSSNAAIANLEEIDASGAAGGVEISMSAQTEAFTITGGTGADTLTGGAAADIIDGGNGNNILNGLGGSDTITGGTGNDTILGGDGDDVLIGGDGDDTIYGATIIGESGVESAVQTNSSLWHTVTFSASILNPIVKMSSMTNNDGDPYTIRVRNLTETGFEWQIDEFDYLDGSRSVAEEISWLAIEEGTHTLDNGAVIQAGRTTATNENQTTVTFNSAFGSAPVVLSQVMTDNDSAAVVTRNRNASTTNFQVNMLEEEDADGTHATEEIGWIAIEAVGSPASGFLVGATTATVDETVTTINFGGTFDNVPVFVHDQQTTNGGDTSYSKADGVTTTTARVLIQEEQSRDSEVNHPGRESVGYFALNEGLLTAAGGGDNSLSGGAGQDTLFGGDGLDTFIFEAVSAFADRDILADFSTGEGDILDISDLLTVAFSGTITDFVNFDDSSGTDTIVQVDRDGTAGGFGFQDIAEINGITGLDEATLYSNGNIVV